jgi:hypothetical protein
MLAYLQGFPSGRRRRYCGTASDDLDAVEIGQRHVLRFPEHAAEELRVDAAAGVSMRRSGSRDAVVTSICMSSSSDSVFRSWACGSGDLSEAPSGAAAHMTKTRTPRGVRIIYFRHEY